MKRNSTVVVYCDGFCLGVAGVRGVAAGFLTAFDKHWNFALTSGEIRLGRGRIGQSPKTEKKRLD